MTYIDIEPISGTTMAAAFKTQANFKIQPFNFTTGNITNVWFEHIPETYLPILWADQVSPPSCSLTLSDKVIFSMVH